MFEKYDSEKQELYDQIRELEKACEDTERTRLVLLEKHFFNKWLFFSKIHTLRAAEGETREQLAIRTEKFMTERELKLRDIERITKERLQLKEESFVL